MVEQSVTEQAASDSGDLPVGVGVQVEIEFVDEQGGRERLVVQIVREEAADFDQGLLSVTTPLAKVLLGKRTGREIDYHMGDIRKLRILRVAPGTAPAPTDAAERRQAALQKAVEEVQRTNAEIFAASYTGKWGDYQLNDE